MQLTPVFGYWRSFRWYKRLWCWLGGIEHRGVYAKGIMDKIAEENKGERYKWYEETDNASSK